jgi:aspartate ammonia-lyase
LAVVFSDDPLIESVKNLIEAFDEKGREFSNVLKLGRTQLQDAVPMTLGQEFHGYAVTLGEDLDRMAELATLFAEVNMGGTAIGTGINTDPQYAPLIIKKLAEVTGVPVTLAPNLVEASSDMGEFLLFSGMLRRLAVKLSKIVSNV